MKITLEPDLPDENFTEPIVVEHITTAGIVYRHAGIVGQVNGPIVHWHGNLWDIYHALGDARDQTLVLALQKCNVMPIAKPPEKLLGKPPEEPPPDATLN